jgi:hypothetical protein
MPDPRLTIPSQVILNIDHINARVSFQAIQNNERLVVIRRSQTFCESASLFLGCFWITGRLLTEYRHDSHMIVQLYIRLRLLHTLRLFIHYCKCIEWGIRFNSAQRASSVDTRAQYIGLFLRRALENGDAEALEQVILSLSASQKE